MKIATAAAVLFLLPLAAQEPAPAAAEHPVARAMQSCLEKAQTTKEMVTCTAAAREGWAAEVEKNAKELVDLLDPEARRAFITAQGQWLKFREAERASLGRIYSLLSGTMFAVMREDDEMEAFQNRALELKKYIDLLKQSRP